MARVEETNADVYLCEHATIFAYNPASRMLLWARHNEGGKCWELHKNGKQIAEGRPPFTMKNADLTTHYEMVNWAKKVQENVSIPEVTEDYIRGRISPDKNTIYIHDLKSRYCGDDLRLGFDRHVKFTLKKVGMYMKSEKNGVINYDIKKRAMDYQAERVSW
jgi:hypothetical protein